MNRQHLISTNKHCLGCGITLQDQDRSQLGYTPKLEADYCQRCFRLIHYGDLQVSMKQGIDPDLVFKQIEQMDGMILLILDAFDFESNLIDGLSRKVGDKPIIAVLSKRDLLPETLGDQKLANFVIQRLKQRGIQVSHLVLTSAFRHEGMDELWQVIDQYPSTLPCIVMGKANAGKSTLLNQLLQKEQLTTSRYPGTTLAFQQLMIQDRLFVDTPGIEVEGSMLQVVDDAHLKTIIPQKTLKPKVYQFYEDQAYVIGGLCKIDIQTKKRGSLVMYVHDELSIHRTKLENSQQQFKKHYGTLFQPTPLVDQWTKYTFHLKETSMDIVIDGLGWINIQGSIQQVDIHLPKDVQVRLRKAML